MAAILTLYHREDCHLCEEFHQALQAVLCGKNVVLKRIDIDQNPEQRIRFNDAVPILLADGEEICRYWLDSTKLNDWLAKIG